MSDESKRAYIERQKALYANKGALYTQDVRGNVTAYHKPKWEGFTREMQSNKGIFSAGKRHPITGNVLDYYELNESDRG